MFNPLQRRALLTGLVLLAVPWCLSGFVNAGDDADVRAAFMQGAALHERGDYAGAIKAFERALDLAPRILGAEHPNTVTIMNNLATVYDATGQYAKAEPLYQRSLKIREKQLGPDHPDVAESLGNLAHVYGQMVEYAKAELLYQRSLKIRESRLGADHPEVAQTLNNLAVLYKDMGQYAKAESLYRRSLKIFESKLGPDHADMALILNNVAALYKELGQYAKAEPLYLRSLKIHESNRGPDHPFVADSLNNLAGLYRAMGQYAKAEPFYQRSLKIRESRLGPEHRAVAASLDNLANLYHDMGQHIQAEPLRLRSLKIRESQLGPDHPEVATSLHNLANLYRDLDQYAKVEPFYQRSLKIRESKLGPDHPEVAASLTGLGLLYKDMGQYAKAEPFYQRSLKIWESQLGPDHPDVAEYGLHNLVLLHAANEQWADAVAETDRARRIVRRHVARTLPILSEKEQLSFLQSKDEERLHTALTLGLNQRADAQIALRSAGWILNGKAVAQEVLAQRAILTVEGTDPSVAELVKQLLSVRSRLAALSMTLPASGQEADHRQKLEKLSQEEQDLSRQLGRATGRDAGGDPWVEPAAVRQALAKEAVLIEVARHRVFSFKAKGKEDCWSAPHYVAWLIPSEERGQITIVDLGEAQKIDAAVQTARGALEKATKNIDDQGEAKAEKQLREAMRDISRLVLEPLEKHLGQARELVVSPDAALWLVPWGALPLADGKYAIEKYQIRYVISGRDLVVRSTSKGRKTTNPVLFANPDYDLGPGDTLARTRAVLRSATPVEQVIGNRVPGSLSSLPQVRRLPGTAAEVVAIKPSVARYAKEEAVVYEDQYALEGVFKSLHGPWALVLCTHGFFLPDQEVAHRQDRAGTLSDAAAKGRAVLTTEGKPVENPLLRCGLLLTGCNRSIEDSSGDDGILTGLEIVGTDLRGTELVVLSACETGLGQVRNGEGVSGLRQAFQLAGADAVVSTLWKIPDEETVDVMNVFFAYLSQGQSKAEALRNAQLAIIKVRRADHSAAHPFYWAAFTLTGK